MTPSLVTSRSEINHGGFDFQAEGLLYPKTRTLGAPKDCSITTFRPSRRSLWTQQVPHFCFMTFSMGYSWWFAGILRWSQGNLMENTLDINGHWMGFHGDFRIEKSYRVIILGWSPPSASMNHGLGPHGHGHGIGQLVATSPMSHVMCLSRKFQKDHPRKNRQTPQKKK